MTVRAKFLVTKVECTSVTIDKVPQEMRTIVLNPVYSQDPNSENRQFWKYSPSGEIRLGTVNQSAWEQFVLNEEYYVDFVPANKG